MKYSKLFFALSITFCIVALLTGCGDNDKQQIDLTTSTLNGVASKGPIKSGSVKVYALEADGAKGALLGTGTTGADGSYSVDIGSYTGDVVVEVSGGTYTDEATGATDTPNTLLRAALSGVSGTVTIAVTPLTEIAVQYAEDPNTETSIDAANSLVSSMVGVVPGFRPAPVPSSNKPRSATPHTCLEIMFPPLHLRSEFPLLPAGLIPGGDGSLPAVRQFHFLPSCPAGGRPGNNQP